VPIPLTHLSPRFPRIRKTTTVKKVKYLVNTYLRKLISKVNANSVDNFMKYLCARIRFIEALGLFASSAINALVEISKMNSECVPIRGVAPCTQRIVKYRFIEQPKFSNKYRRLCYTFFKRFPRGFPVNFSKLLNCDPTANIRPIQKHIFKLLHGEQ
jgi:hypothetical protein